MALLRGYVVAIPGARGRSSYVTIKKKKVCNGKAPAAILDLKAAVRLYARIRAFIDFFAHFIGNFDLSLRSPLPSYN